MNRISLTDNSGRWFDRDLARRFDEAKIVADDGTSISRATGNSWEHEALLLTTKGEVILFSGSDRNPSLSSFKVIEPDIAIKWLLANGHGNQLDQWECRKEAGELEL